VLVIFGLDNAKTHRKSDIHSVQRVTSHASDACNVNDIAQECHIINYFRLRDNLYSEVFGVICRCRQMNIFT